LGRPATAHAGDLRVYAAGLEEREGIGGRVAEPPSLQAGHRVPGSDLDLFAEALIKLLDQPQIPLERRLRQCAALAALCRRARFDNASGSRLREFLDLVTQSVAAEVRPTPAFVPEPS